MPDSVTSADREHEGEYEGDDYHTPLWDNFQVKMNTILAHTRTQLDAAALTLGSDPDIPKLKALQGRIARLKTDFFHFTEAYHRITTEEYIENDANLYLNLQETIAKLEDLESVTSTRLSHLQPLPIKAHNSDAAILAAFMNVANSPPVELPTFDGKNISEYAAFKEKFQFIIQYISGPKELWATHLENKLTDDAKRYVGSKSSWYNKYSELWEALDDKYANRWNIATEAVRNFFYEHRPENNQEAVLNWFHQQLDHLRSVINLDMTVEEIGTNLILQTLPNDYAREVRSGLRVANANNKKKAAFSIKELRTVVNDTIAIKHDSESFSPPKSIMTLQTAATPTVAVSALGAPQSQQPPYQLRGRSRGKTRGGRFRGGAGRRRGRVMGARGGRVSCRVCDTPIGHHARDCPTFDTPQKRRNHLASKDKCTSCAHPRHAEGVLCADYIRCIHHPGQRHLDWLCGGDPHPSLQA